MSRATIQWISGPVLHAITEGPFAMREAVRVGPQALLGEVVRIDGDRLPLAIRVGPGLVGNIFDGLLRPLSGTGSDFVQPGMRHPPAGTFRFVPHAGRGDVVGLDSADRRRAR
jgi:V/A-type H+-transporting ATPase subunit A